MFRDTHAFSGFSVDDIERARAFYADTLGLEVVDRFGMLGLRLAGGGEVLIYPKDDHAPAGFTVLNFPVADIDVAVDGLAAAGVRLETYPRMGGEPDARGIYRGGPGPSIAWFTDPAGNVLSVLEEIPEDAFAS